jgi:protein-S-isoprenylcysteine O-methyltransferase Ste14
MTSDELFRWFFIAIFVITISISGYFRYRARRSGEAIPRAREGKHILALRILIAGPLFLSILAYAVNPDWMAWSSIPLPNWLRWVAAAVGLGMLPVVYWTVSTLGRNISETFLTRKSHTLVTQGPYRWVRHPLYSVATVEFVSLGILAANWFMVLMSVVILIAISLLIIPWEEEELERKFGTQYRDYIERTGRLVPRPGSFV